MLLALLLAAAPAKPVHLVDAGPLRLQLLVAETPQVFHVVDQLAGWNPFAHKQYRRWFAAAENGGLSAEDEAALAAHAALRKRQSYGPLENALDVDLPLDDALDAAVAQRVLTRADADLERRVLLRFLPRVRKLALARREAIAGFARQLDDATPELRSYAEQASRFFGGSRVDRTLVLVPSPKDGGGGGFNGGRLVVEVNGSQAPTEILEHECWHAFAEPHEAELHAAAAEVGTDFETLSEGLAYAVAPGIYRPAANPEALAHTVADDLAAHRAFFEEPYVRFNRLGLAMRPTLEPMLRGAGTFEEALPIEKAVYRALAAVASAEGKPTARYFWFGPQDKALMERIAAGTHDIWSRPATSKFAQELRPMIRPSDVVILALATGDELPRELVSLLGPEAAVLAAKRQASVSGEAKLRATNGELVVAIWAGDAPAVLALAGKSTLLPR